MKRLWGKKILSGILTMCMLLTILPITPAAASTDEIITDNCQRPLVSTRREPGDDAFDIYDTGHPEFKLPAIGKNITDVASLYYDMDGREIRNIDAGVVLVTDATLDDYQIFYRLSDSMEFIRLPLEIAFTEPTAAANFSYNSVRPVSALPAGVVELKVSFTGAAGWYAFQEHLTMMAVDSLTLAEPPAVDSLTAPFGSTLSDVIGLLGADIELQTKEGSSVKAALTWDTVTTPVFDGSVAGSYVFTGEVGLPAGVKNPDGHSLLVTATVTVAPQSEDHASLEAQIAQMLFDARNSTTESEVLAAIKAVIQNKDLPMSISGWTLKTATAKDPGSITGTLYIGEAEIPLNIFIPTLNSLTDECTDLSYPVSQEGAFLNTTLAGRKAIVKDPAGLTDGTLPAMSLNYDMNGQYLRTVSINILEKSGSEVFSLLARNEGETTFKPVDFTYNRTENNISGSGYNAGVISADLTGSVAELKLVFNNTIADELAVTEVKLSSSYFDPRVKFYEDFIKNESAWIRSLQITSGSGTGEDAVGAIPMAAEGRNAGRMMPYFTEIAVMALLDIGGPENIKAAKGYIDWHFWNMNDGSSDYILDIDGTVYDYKITATYGENGGIATSQELSNVPGDYDSSDSYAALLFSSLNKYYELTGDTQYLKDNFDNINRVLNALYATMNEFDLTWAKANYHAAYMMDNAEVLEGLRNAIDIYAALEQALTGADQTLARENLAEVTQSYKDVKAAIEEHLWDAENQDYLPYMDAGKVTWSTFYADATCQAFAITTGAAGDYPGRAQALWETFNSYYSGESTQYHWENIDIPDYYIWGSLSYAASLTGDYERVNTYVETYIKLFELNDQQHADPLYIGDAGQTLRAACVMLDYYKGLAADTEPIDPTPEPEPSTNSYDDIFPDDWFYDDVLYVTEYNLMAGTGNNLFSPDISLTRAMLVTVLWNMAGAPKHGSESGFSDVSPDTWYAEAVTWASENGIVAGYGGGLFGPGDDITRQDMAVMMAHYIAYTGRILPGGTPKVFDDAAIIANYAKAAVDQLTAEGVIYGKPNNLFDPKAMATRAEVAVMIHKLHKIL